MNINKGLRKFSLILIFVVFIFDLTKDAKTETLNQSREYIEQFGITDTLPVIGFVETNITFGNLEWNIGITTSEEVFLTL